MYYVLWTQSWEYVSNETPTVKPKEKICQGRPNRTVCAVLNHDLVTSLYASLHMLGSSTYITHLAISEPGVGKKGLCITDPIEMVLQYQKRSKVTKPTSFPGPQTT